MPSLDRLTALLQKRPRIVATADMTEDAIAELGRIGHTTLLGWANGEWFAEPDALKTACAAAQVLIAGYEPIDASLMDGAPDLSIIASVRGAPGANVDIGAATERGIAVLHTVGRTDNGVAEFTVALALALCRNLTPAAAWFANRPDGFDPGLLPYRGTVWGHAGTSPQLAYTGFEIDGRIAGIVGFGGIGRSVAQKLSALGMHCLVHDPFVDPYAIRQAGHTSATLHDLLERSILVSLHARLSAATRGMIGATELKLMQPNAYLINTGRAGLIDAAALLKALDTGTIAGAALDVFDDEPPVRDDLLAAHPRVLATPHLAAWTLEMQQRHSASIIENLQRIRRGDHAIDIANPEILSQN